ncbi:hypothetical protein L0152_13935 [bacterium]|nr:hypothetical protein [bacterium]
MICIYHSRDLDGFTSAAIVKRKYPEAKLIGFDYGQKLPMEQVPNGEPIIMIDVSLPMPQMLELAKHSGWQLKWIDHHISAINEYKEFVGKGEAFMTAVISNGIAACEIAWKHFFPDENMPEAVRLLGEYDTWRNHDKQTWENSILPFQFGMRQICNSPETFPESMLTQRSAIECIPIINNGKIILNYQAQTNELQCKKAAFEHEFEGLRAICLNGGGFNSDVFKSVYDESRHDIMMPFQFDGKQWTISLYTTKDEVDCSAIAKSKGGGGHKKASGFQVKDIREIFPAI